MKRNLIAAAVLGPVAVAAGLLPAPPAATSTGAAVSLTGAASADLPDFQTAMAQADTDIAVLAGQDIWGREIFAHQQDILHGFTEGLDRLAMAQAVGLNGAAPPADDPGVGFYNAVLTASIDHLDDIEQHMPVIAETGIPLSAQLAEVPELLFDEVRMFGVDYTQVLPAALLDLADTFVAGFG